MASASCSSDEDYHNYETESEDILEDSLDESDSDYDPENEIGESDSDSSVETLSASEGEQHDDSASGPPSPGPAVSRFTLLCDPFADKRPDPLPSLKQEFANVHPGVIAHHESEPMSVLQCFKLFFDSDIVASLCSWTNTRAAYHFRDNPTSDPHRFIGRTWVNVTEDEMYVFLALHVGARAGGCGIGGECFVYIGAWLR